MFYIYRGIRPSQKRIIRAFFRSLTPEEREVLNPKDPTKFNTKKFLLETFKYDIPRNYTVWGTLRETRKAINDCLRNYNVKHITELDEYGIETLCDWVGIKMFYKVEMDPDMC